MNEQNQYMLFFSLGPVQPFIEQARKTRDLWGGSLLLSKIMEAAMAGINAQFIFPAKRGVVADQESGAIPDIPNKYIAIFDSAEQASKTVEQSIEQIEQYWWKTCDAVWREIIEDHDDEETRTIWRRQTGIDPKNSQSPISLDNLFEVYWVIVPRDGSSYGDWYKKTEETLAARKRLRDFKALDEHGEKSSVSGLREALHREQANFKAIQEFWKEIALRKKKRLSPKDINQEGRERLDALDTIKRFAMRARATVESPFPSTSSIATASFVERLLDATPGLTELQAWLKITDELSDQNSADTPYLEKKAERKQNDPYMQILRRDGDLYFPETFAQGHLKDSYNVRDETKAKVLIEQGNKALKNLLQTVTDTLKIPRPTPYYAAMQMDGDRMGILLSGVRGGEEHTAISQALSHFSRITAVDLVEKQYPARLVYAGGDDVLAFAPLTRSKNEQNENQPQHVFELLQKLQEEYCREVREALRQRNPPKVSSSASVVIAHHYTPLSYVLHTTREAEKIAKSRYDRNALVVTLIRRSGEQTRVGCHWRYPGFISEGQPIALFSKFYEFFKDDVLSPKCVHTLLEEAPALIAMDDTINVENADKSAMQSEIKRVLKRQRNPARQVDFPDDMVKTYASHLARLAVLMNPPQDDDDLPTVELHEEDRKRYGLVEVLGWLLVMAFLARKGEE